MTPALKKTALALALAFGTAGAAHAVLERAGPTSLSPQVGGYPEWYQDTTGLALEFCSPNAAELAGGWCLLLPGDAPAVPEVFPSAFGDEHFYWAATASAPAAAGTRALLVLAQEAAFAAGGARPGDQIVFARIRMVLNPVPVGGRYRIIHPFGEDFIDAPAGGKIFYTEDIGIGSPGDFTGALSSRLGPFLLPSSVPGGAEMPPLTAGNPAPDTDPAHFGGAFAPTPYPGTGKAYIADPARIGPVTGSALPDFVDSTGALRNHNIFRIEGPAGSALGVDPATGASVDYVETTDFSLMGRVFTNQLPSRIVVERASYERDALGQKLDVFATAAATAQSRLPAQPRPAAVAPQLTFYDAPCAGTIDPATGEIKPPFSAPAGANEFQMFSIPPGLHHGQATPPAIPATVCVKDSAARDANGNIVPVFVPQPVSDLVNISQASFDGATGTLTVSAASSDAVSPPTLRLTFGNFQGELVNGSIVVPNLIAAPSSVRVHSSALGAEQRLVATAAAAVTPPSLPVAVNDAYSMFEDGGAQVLAVLGNDSNAAGGAVALTSAPRLGSAVVNADGTVTYTPNLNANGTDQFTYTVTLGAQTSNTATATIDIAPVNDPPLAVNDATNAIAGIAKTINLLANDSDPDGAADLAAAVGIVPPAGVTMSVTGGTVNFLAAAAGTYSFTYQAQDVAGALSANAATVTVQVAAAETVSIAKNEYVRSKSFLKAAGTVSPAAGQTVRIDFVDAAGNVVGFVGTYPTDAAGAWQVATTAPLPAGASAMRVTTSNGAVRASALVFK